MPDSSEKDLIRFACPSCGTRLVVDRALAGTEGPCQSCGALLTVPPLEVSRTLSAKQAAPLAVQPRLPSRKRKPAPSSPFELVEEAKGSPPVVAAKPAQGKSSDKAGPAPVPAAERSRKPAARRSRSVSPATALSQSHEDKKNIKAFITMAIVTCVVACIALGIYYFMVYGQY